MIKATPLNKLFPREGSPHVERSSLRAEWRARLENKLGRARTVGIFDVLGHEAYIGNVRQDLNNDSSNDGFPHREMPIFARNEQD